MSAADIARALGERAARQRLCRGIEALMDFQFSAQANAARPVSSNSNNWRQRAPARREGRRPGFPSVWELRSEKGTRNVKYQLPGQFQARR